MVYEKPTVTYVLLPVDTLCSSPPAPPSYNGDNDIEMPGLPPTPASQTQFLQENFPSSPML